MALMKQDSFPADRECSLAGQSVSIYESLGIRPIINCGSVRTFYGNSLMLDRVRLAMEQAAQEFVLIDELAEAIGARLARLTGAEWGMVTAGSAAGLALASAACVAGNDPERMLRLPSSDGVNIVLAPAGHRFAYDQAIRAVGVRIHEFDSIAALEDLLTSRPIAMISILADRDDESSPLSLERIAATARRFNVPILVDAASDFLQAPIPWLSRGADLVVFSVGKFMCGPAAAGLLLGREPLVRAAWVNGPPHQAFGRMLKISKEQMVGALVALEAWLDRDPQADDERWSARIEQITSRICPLPDVSVETVRQAGRVPKLRVSWNRTFHPITSEGLRRALLGGSPRILIDDIGATEHSVLIDPFNITEHEASHVGDAVRRALQRPTQPRAQLIEPAVNLTGRWVVEIDFANGTRAHEFRISQDGGRLSGEHVLTLATAELRGTVEGTTVLIESTHMCEGNVVRFAFRAENAERSTLEGMVTMGASAAHTLGPMALGQFGEARWQGKRPE
jgi:D-glucosaminate-6-phosphate ammonia-lyase